MMTNLVDLVGAIAKQAMNNQNSQQQPQQNQSGLDSILGSVLGNVLGGGQSQQQAQPKSGLDGILGSVLGSVLGGSQQKSSGSSNMKTAILMAVIPLILNWIQQQGGLQGALDKLRGSGMSSQVNNWVDPNANNDEAPVNQVQALFNDQDICQVADQAQCSKQDVYGAISSVLPQVINALTPQGNQTNTNEANDDIQNVINMISKFMK